MVDYVRAAATAQRLIEKNGRTVTLRRDGETPADAAKPWRGPSSTPAETLTPKMAFVPPSGSGFGHVLVTSDGLAEQYDQIGLLAVNSVPGSDIEQFDTVEDTAGGRDRAWRIANVQFLDPGDTPLVYALGLKG